MADDTLRCAVYTRKSTEDGLEQEFNSLDAQYEACAAYALSQQHEGWVLIKDRYDDGGFSGGNMDRPGLKRLLADIEAGTIDIVLLYKIDRLTRSLTDFSKIVEVMDATSASFVSITQSFNTTTSMGRLANADLLAAHLRSGTSEKKAGLIESLVKRINLSEVEVTVQLDTAALIKLLGLPEPEDRLAPMTIRIPAMKVRRGHQLRLIVPGKNPALNKPAQRDPKLVALIAGALAARKLVEDNPERSIADLAAAQGRCRTRLGNLVRISCLAPDIVQSIVGGRQPSSLNAKTLTKQTLPIDWAGQRKLLGLV